MCTFVNKINEMFPIRHQGKLGSSSHSFLIIGWIYCCWLLIEKQIIYPVSSNRRATRDKSPFRGGGTKALIGVHTPLIPKINSFLENLNLLFKNLLSLSKLKFNYNNFWYKLRFFFFFLSLKMPLNLHFLNYTHTFLIKLPHQH